jgi:hypothetical protein
MTPEEQAAVDALKKEHQDALDALQAKLTTADERVANAQKKINDFGNEVGELRKDKEALKVAKEELATSKTEAAKFKADLEALSNAGPKNKAGDKGGKQDEETEDQLLEKLTKEQRTLVDQIYAKATPEDQAELDSNPEFRVKFLKEVIKKTTKPSPKSFFRSTPEQRKTQDDSEERLAKLFNTKKKRSAFTPEGPSGGAGADGHVLPIDEDDDTESRPVYTGGDMNSFLKRVRETSSV